MKNFYIISVDKIYSSREPGLTCNVNECIKTPNKSTFWCRIWVIDTLRQPECKDCQAAGAGHKYPAVSAAARTRWRALAASLLLLRMVKLGTTAQQHNNIAAAVTNPRTRHTHSAAGEIFASDIAPRPLCSLLALFHWLPHCHCHCQGCPANLDTEARAAETRSTETRCGVIGNERRADTQSLTRSDAPAADWDSKRYR